MGHANAAEVVAAPSRPALASSLIAGAIDAVYLVVIARLGGPSDVTRVPFVAVAIAAAATCALAAAIAPIGGIWVT